MKRDSFSYLKVFVEIAHRGGFPAATQHLQQAPAFVSEAVQRFEDRLGIQAV